MSQCCSYLLNWLTSSNNICCTPVYMTQMDNRGSTSPGAEPRQWHNALSKDDTQFFQVTTEGWGYISGRVTWLAHREPWVQPPALWARQDNRKPCCTYEERSKETVYVFCVFKQCYNSNVAKWLVHQGKQLKWPIFNKQFTSYVNIYNESILLQWASHTVCLFCQTSKDFCFPQDPKETNKHYIVPYFHSVVK